MRPMSLGTGSISLFRFSKQFKALFQRHASGLRAVFRPAVAAAVVVVACMLGWASMANGGPNAGVDPFGALQDDLVRDGFDGSLIRDLYSRPEVSFDQKGIATYYLHREATVDYGQFLSKSLINRAMDYVREHRAALEEAQGTFGVEKEVITAIILVESRLGGFIGSRLVLNTLSTLAALGRNDIRDRIWTTHLKGKEEGSRPMFDSWAARKSTWAYDELKAYLKYVQMHGIDPLSVRGSFAGALGIAQFVPTSVLRFARDGNHDGRIDLFDHEDAICSIANYLGQQGWCPSLKRGDAFRVLLSYNNSKYYADTILDVAERLAQGQGQ